jgi:hypothetical protein
MTTTSFSEQILRALVAHAALSSRQLANMISNTPSNTSALISYMCGNGKLEKAGMCEDVATYRITERGMFSLGLPIDDQAPARLRIAKDIPVFTASQPASAAAHESDMQTSARGQPAADAASTPGDFGPPGAGSTMQDLAFPVSIGISRRAGRAVREPIQVRAGDAVDIAADAAPRFGLLDSGELIVLRGGSALPIIFPAEATERLRAMLAGAR